jgi:hypothetical protein
MLRWLWGTLIVSASLALAPAAAAPGASSATQRIVAVGDLHGDFKVWLAIARAAGIVDPQGHWSGGATTLVQLGDFTDRGPDSLEIVRSLQRLQKEASRARGRVVVVIGNHEAMQMIGDNRYTHPGEYAAFVNRASSLRRTTFFDANQAAIAAAYRAREPKLTDDEIRARWLAEVPLGKIEHDAAWSASGDLGRWTMTNPAVVLIDGNLFVHGGLSRAYAAVPLAEINRQVWAALEARDESPEAIISAEEGPLWYRGYAEPRAAAPRQPDPAGAELTAVLAAAGAKRMVIAHTPLLSGIAILHGGRLVRIDTGNSAYYGGTPSYLEIVGDRLVAHAVPRPAGDVR